jgi:hypothetical protein
MFVVKFDRLVANLRATRSTFQREGSISTKPWAELLLQHLTTRPAVGLTPDTLCTALLSVLWGPTPDENAKKDVPGDDSRGNEKNENENKFSLYSF